MTTRYPLLAAGVALVLAVPAPAQTPAPPGFTSRQSSSEHVPGARPYGCPGPGP